MEIEGEAGYGEIKGRFRLNHSVAVESLEKCKPKVIPVRKNLRTEKWIVHLDFFNKITQKKVGD